jgi:hypothetical protein
MNKQLVINCMQNLTLTSGSNPNLSPNLRASMGWIPEISGDKKWYPPNTFHKLYLFRTSYNIRIGVVFEFKNIHNFLNFGLSVFFGQFFFIFEIFLRFSFPSVNLNYFK